MSDRERAIEAAAKDRADWLLDAVACATQNRQFLRGEPEYDDVAGDAILLGAGKAIRVAIDAYEAAMREAGYVLVPVEDRLKRIDYSCDLQRIIEDLCNERPIRKPETTAHYHYDMAAAYRQSHTDSQ